MARSATEGFLDGREHRGTIGPVWDEGVRVPAACSFAYHLATKLAKNTPHIKFEIDPRIAAGQIADAPHGAIAPALVQASTITAQRFFESRTSLMMRALRSPKMPRTVPSGRKPGNAYASHNRRFRFAEAAIEFAPDFEHASTCSKPCSDAALRGVNA